jgi:hypothetical protein
MSVNARTFTLVTGKKYTTGYAAARLGHVHSDSLKNSKSTEVSLVFKLVQVLLRQTYEESDWRPESGALSHRTSKFYHTAYGTIEH